MEKYKPINQFDLQDCERFLKINPNSPYEDEVRQQYAKLQDEAQQAIRIQQERKQQELNEQIAKENKRKTRYKVLLAIFLTMAFAAAIIIILTYTN